MWGESWRVSKNPGMRLRAGRRERKMLRGLACEFSVHVNTFFAAREFVKAPLVVCGGIHAARYKFMRKIFWRNILGSSSKLKTSGSCRESRSPYNSFIIHGNFANSLEVHSLCKFFCPEVAEFFNRKSLQAAV